MDIQRLRNITTGRLHTDIAHIYEDLELLTGIKGIFTHQLPVFAKMVRLHLRKVLPDSRLWEDEYDPTHTGKIDVPVDVIRAAIRADADAGGGDNGQA